MSNLKIFLLEDNEQDYQNFSDASKILRDRDKVEIELVRFKNSADSLSNLDNSFDGAIIDMKIGSDSGAGNEIADKILNDFKIPTAIYTATPAASKVDSTRMKTFKKASTDCETVLKHFVSIYNTGLTQIFGDRGHINKIMKDLFWNNLIPNIKNWEDHDCPKEDKERSLLRVTLNHLMELINSDEFILGEEMYVHSLDRLKTGSIVEYDRSIYVVVTPACDLELRKGVPKTNRILLCEVIEMDKFLLSSFGAKTAEEIRKDIIRKTITNQVPYHHWLPRINDFKGGVLNFRHLVSVPVETVESTKIGLLISQAYIKDITARLSIYYSRQGQPDFAKDYHINNLYQDFIAQEEKAKKAHQTK